MVYPRGLISIIFNTLIINIVKLILNDTIECLYQFRLKKTLWNTTTLRSINVFVYFCLLQQIYHFKIFHLTYLICTLFYRFVALVFFFVAVPSPICDNNSFYNDNFFCIFLTFVINVYQLVLCNFIKIK